MTAGYDKSLQGLTQEARKRAEDKLNRELRQLKSEMDASRCKQCGFTGDQHQDWCPKRDRG